MAPLRCAAKFDAFLSSDCARVEGVGAQGIKFCHLGVEGALNPGAIQGKEGIKLCHLATLLSLFRTRICIIENTSLADTPSSPSVSLIMCGLDSLSKVCMLLGTQF